MRRLVPEVVQTSAMDCGPAALKSLLEGFGIHAGYGRLREACQTDVDGTSIDTIEAAAVQLGLEAEQMMVPLDHMLLAESEALPALVVVRLANGATHFVVVWSKHGPWVQVMDPASGRRFYSASEFLNEVYVHTHTVPAEAWREWAGSDAFLKALRKRMERVGARREQSERLIAKAAEDSGWRGFGTLDAACRMAEALCSGGGVSRGAEAAALMEALTRRGESIPETYWSVFAGEDDSVRIRGAVLVRVRGARGERAADLSPELAAALHEPPARPGRDLFGLLRAEGWLPALLVPAMALAAGSVVLEALLFRGLFEVGRQLATGGQRLGALPAVAAFLAAMLLLEWPLASGLLRLGRKLECRLRVAFLRKLPLLGDRYFQSRLVSDMAERSHAVHQLRALPEQAGALCRAAFEMAFTVAGIAWFFPESLAPAIALGAFTIAVPLAAQPWLAARDLRFRTHGGALSRFYLDSMLGLVAVRAHGAELSLRREQEGMLREWARSGLSLQRMAVALDGVQFAGGLGLAAWLLLRHLAGGGEVAGVLLLVYWTLQLPLLGQSVGSAALQYPGLRNVTLRLMEPLGSPEETRHGSGRTTDGPAAIDMRGVTVVAAGHTILDSIDLRIEPGEHVGIVGPSGAGKSSLVGLLLGWHRPAAGSVLVDGEALDAETLRGSTAWVDPQVQIWNRSLYDNLQYSSGSGDGPPLESVMESSDLRGVLQKLPDGLQSVLGEGGALVSGGEGQRVRLGRAMMQGGVRLAILDEPARGLDRAKRQAMVARAREIWRGATLLCITHDVADTLDFSRVLVIDKGRVAEDGNPSELSRNPDSRYRALLDAEHAVRSGLWSSGVWRRVRIDGGRLQEAERRGAPCVTR